MRQPAAWVPYYHLERRTFAIERWMDNWTTKTSPPEWIIKRGGVTSFVARYRETWAVATEEFMSGDNLPESRVVLLPGMGITRRQYNEDDGLVISDEGESLMVSQPRIARVDSFL